MALSDRIGADLRSTFLRTSELAETVTYTPDGGSPVAIPAVPEPDALVQGDVDDGTILDGRMRIFIGSDPDDPDRPGIASPTVKDVVAYEGEDWSVTSIDSSESKGGHTLELRRITHREKAGEAHRMRR